MSQNKAEATAQVSPQNIKPKIIEHVYNDCYGGFTVSNFARKQELEFDASLIDLIKKYGSKKCSTDHSRLKIARFNCPSNIEPELLEQAIDVHEYDGLETPKIDVNCLVVLMLQNNKFKTIAEAQSFIEFVNHHEFREKDYSDIDGDDEESQ